MNLTHLSWIDNTDRLNAVHLAVTVTTAVTSKTIYVLSVWELTLHENATTLLRSYDRQS